MLDNPQIYSVFFVYEMKVQAMRHHNRSNSFHVQKQHVIEIAIIFAVQ